MTTVDIPRRHLVHETPEGTRWFYPAPSVPDRSASTGEHVTGWEDEQGAALRRISVDERWRNKPDWLVSDHELFAVVAVVQGADVLEGYRRRPLEELAEADELTATLLTASGDMLNRFPQYIGREGLPSKEECGCTEDTYCTWHQVFRRAYERVVATPEPRRVRIELEESVPLTGGADPAPDRVWKVSDAVRAYYGGTVVHALPGYLDTNISAIGAAVEVKLAELGLTGWTVYAFEREGTVSCSGEIPWDEPRPWAAMEGRSKQARQHNATAERKSRMAMSYRREIRPPRSVPGETKAEALAKEAEFITEAVAMLVPNHTHACSHCDGTGYIG